MLGTCHSALTVVQNQGNKTHVITRCIFARTSHTWSLAVQISVCVPLLSYYITLIGISVLLHFTFGKFLSAILIPTAKFKLIAFVFTQFTSSCTKRLNSSSRSNEHDLNFI